ncbi:MAG: UDP-N-acetylmuramate--L-alanine ligase [Spirochaetales bacterium]|nr:UDP-N-acetylmuramate--L-alanine ligase [Spirochaetales bacterium]
MLETVEWKNLTGKKIFLIGIKGTGVAALAEILLHNGALVYGSDIPDRFYTDEILKSLNIRVYEGFSKNNVEKHTDFCIYSSAYSPVSNPDLKEVFRLKLPSLSYPEALGRLSLAYDSSAIAGVHGKTTTTAMTGTLIKYLEIPATVLVGSAVSSFNNRSTLYLGDRFFVAETCEYRRNFLNFKPNRIVLTNVEMDHPDYFRDLNDIYDAFSSYIRTLPENGCLIYNFDDPGARFLAEKTGDDISCCPFGFEATGPFKIRGISVSGGRTTFKLGGFDRSFEILIPGRHSVYNAVSAIALVTKLLQSGKGGVDDEDLEKIAEGLLNFKGSRRRSEIIGEVNGILFMDDYGHHPTAILKTLEGLREFYPDRRIIVDFMSHTYSRTKALLNDFGKCFKDADIVILHKIYASAREVNQGGITGQLLCEEVKKNRESVYFFSEPAEAASFLLDLLAPNDLFITMGAGDNWKLGKQVYDQLSGKRP